MIKFKLLLVISFCYHFANGQGLSNLWLMGYSSWGGRPFGGVNMDFISGSLDTSYQSRRMNFAETNGVICDKNGTLLFSSNGIWIANGYNDTLLNGHKLNPSAYTSANDSNGLYISQANLIIPDPSDSNKYYLFHQTVDDYPGSNCSFYLYYSIIDMSRDAGKGEVIDKNHILLSDSLITGGLTACKHANGRDWWLVAHHFNSSNENMYISSSTLYYKFLITPYGILGPDTQSVGTPRAVASGQCVFSPDGKYFANNNRLLGLDIFDFDRCTGIFTSKIHIPNDTAPVDGAAFSPNSKLLYASTGYGVDQFDLSAPDIAASKTTIAQVDSTSTGFYLSQLAPDGKIYIASGSNVAAMHLINNPDIIGTGCNVCNDCVTLPALNAWTVPNHPNYFLGAETGSVCDTLTGLTPALSKGEGVLQVYPNPVATEDVTFTYNVSSEPGVLSVYSIEGKKIAQYQLPQWSSVQHLKLPKLAQGIYMARLKQGNVVSSVKFVKE